MSRLSAAVALEWRVEWRSRIAVVALAVTAVWALVLAVLPARAAAGLAPYVLLVDTATFGAFFIAALYLFERGEGAFAALSVTPMRFGEYLGVKLATLTGLSLGSALVLAVAAGARPAGVALLLSGVAAVSVLVLALCFAMVVPHRSLSGFLVSAPVPLVPLIAVPLAHLAGVAEHPLVFAVPTTGAMEVIRAGFDPEGGLSGAWAVAALGYALAWTAAAALVARSQLARERRSAGPGGPPLARERRSSGPDRAPLARERRFAGDGTRRRGRGHGTPRSAWWAVAFARIDLRGVSRSALLLVVLAGSVVLAVAVRFGYPPLAGYVLDRTGVDLAPYRSLVLAAIIVLHVPFMLGTAGALLVLDDADDRTLLVLRVSPVTLPRYLAYRSVSVGLAALLVLVVAVPVSGLASWADLPTLLPSLTLAAAQAPLVVLAVTAFAGNKVEGLGLLKIIGGVFTGVAPALWWLPEPVAWVVRALPGAWVAETLWRPGPWAWFAGAALTAAACALLARRAVRRLTG